MSYSVNLRFKTYRHWNTFKEWCESTYHQHTNYAIYLQHMHEDLIESVNINNSPEITFKSEAHYHWFLLQQ